MWSNGFLHIIDLPVRHAAPVALLVVVLLLSGLAIVAWLPLAWPWRGLLMLCSAVSAGRALSQLCAGSTWRVRRLVSSGTGEWRLAVGGNNPQVVRLAGHWSMLGGRIAGLDFVDVTGRHHAVWLARWPGEEARWRRLQVRLRFPAAGLL